MDKKIIISMTTIPCRKKRLEENLPSILNQSYKFDKLIINIDDNLTKEDYLFYNSLKKLDKRIKINKADAKWRSCNKLLPTLKLYPEDIIITIDDDIYYPIDCIKYLVEEYKKNPECIIAHEINPIYTDVYEDTIFISYFNNVDIKLKQKEFGKYLSNCCLFPPYVFDGTDLFDYDKMMKCTDGMHDELWFWINSTINGIMCIGLNYIFSFDLEKITPYSEDEFQLSNTNNNDEKTRDYMLRVHEMYGERLFEIIKNNPVIFNINHDNIYSFFYWFKTILSYYPYGIIVNNSNLTKHWDLELISFINDNKPQK